LTITTAAQSTSVRIVGDLDYQTTDDLSTSHHDCSPSRAP
jgi:hypothetical protein